MINACSMAGHSVATLCLPVIARVTHHPDAMQADAMQAVRPRVGQGDLARSAARITSVGPVVESVLEQ